MKKIIGGKKYDTETAKKVGSWSNGYSYRNFSNCTEELYRKRTGEYFLHGRGGPMSKYSESCGNTTYAGEKIIPMTEAEARKWAEEHLDGNDYEEIFGEVEE